MLLTFFSPSGYQQKKDYEGADVVMYLPADCKGNAKYFVRNLKPSVAVFIKYEFWYNTLAELDSQKVPCFFISTLVKGNEPFMKWYGGWFRNRLKKVNHFFVQDQQSAGSLQQIGIKNVTISGDTRFDRVADILENKSDNPDIEKFCEGQKVLLAGSTWPQDEDILKILPQQFPGLKLIIAPHEVKEERIGQLMATFNKDVARYTLDDPSSWLEKQVLIIDTIGILSSVYRYADIAYIGGAFSSGLHNIQEPAVNGMPVIFGPKYHKFREAAELVDQGGAFTIGSKEELHAAISALLEDEAKFKSACEISKRYMIENKGATEKILAGMRNYL